MRAELYEACGNASGGHCRCKVCRVDRDGRLTCKDCGVDRGQLDEHGLVKQGSSLQRPVSIRP